MSFSADMTKYCSEYKVSLNDAARGLKINLFNGIIRDTRVKTGRLRGNWQTTTGSPELNETDRKDNTPQHIDGGIAQENVKYAVGANTVDYMTNNLPYAAIREEKDGMVSGNMARINRTLKEVIANVS